jgi:hypothetical protein
MYKNCRQNQRFFSEKSRNLLPIFPNDLHHHLHLSIRSFIQVGRTFFPWQPFHSSFDKLRTTAQGDTAGDGLLSCERTPPSLRDTFLRQAQDRHSFRGGYAPTRRRFARLHFGEPLHKLGVFVPWWSKINSWAALRLRSG